MAGDFKVRFDMQESTPWMQGYTPIPAKVSGGHESVRVIEDTGRKIVLQHLLVVEMDGESHVIKHWRQDWEYEPARYLAYADTNEWTWEPIDERQRHGRWSQTVYQVDDSPRYAELRRVRDPGRRAPLALQLDLAPCSPAAMRCATRSTTATTASTATRPRPTGWIHWQDNMKMGQFDGELKPVVQEYVLNTYTRFSDYDTKAADAYWAATKGYWAAIRAKWDEVAASEGRHRRSRKKRRPARSSPAGCSSWPTRSSTGTTSRGCGDRRGHQADRRQHPKTLAAG